MFETIIIGILLWLNFGGIIANFTPIKLMSSDGNPVPPSVKIQLVILLMLLLPIEIIVAQFRNDR